MNTTSSNYSMSQPMNTTSSNYSMSQPMNNTTQPMNYQPISSMNYSTNSPIQYNSQSNYNPNPNTMFQPNTTYNPNILPEESMYSNRKFKTFVSDNSSKNLDEEPILIKNRKMKNKNRYVEESDNRHKIKWSRYLKGIVIYTLLFLIMSHIKMNSIVCGVIPYLNNHEILCMTIKGIIMSILIIIIEKLY